ncbi:MAG TPA: hypothetical protein VEK08_11125 [Planctomycetota bacterium]|nr:hypothetical protein [Planctomycetota bacterium]
MLTRPDESTCVLDAVSDLRPLSVMLDPPEGLVSAVGSWAPFQFERPAWSAELPLGTWFEVRFGEHTLDSWFAMQWRGQPRELFLRLDGPVLRCGNGGAAADEPAGVDARTPVGIRELKTLATRRHSMPVSVHLSRLTPTLLAPLVKLKPSAMKIENTGNLREIGSISSLRYLNLESTTITSVSMLTNLRMLSVLDLSYCRALRSISSLAELRNLKVLDLSYCEFLEDFDALDRLARLNALSLNGCVWLQDLSCLKRLENLRLLSLYGCKNIRAEQIEELQRALPHCSIQTGDPVPEYLKDAIRIGVLRLEVTQPYLADGI